MKYWSIPLTLILLLGATPAQTPAETDRARAAYARAQEQLDRGRHEAAIEGFRSALAIEGEHQAGARYWLAYALVKANRRAEALAQLKHLTSAYPGSRWAKQARPLMVEIQGSWETAEERETSGDLGEEWELRLLALQYLAETEPDRAVPALKKLVSERDDVPLEVREHALFVLMQSGHPEAGRLIADLARGSEEMELREAAIHHLAMIGDKQSLALLKDLYRRERSVELREAMLHAFAMSGQEDPIVETARSDESEELREAAIHMLGQLGRMDVLTDLYETEQSRDLREALLHGLMAGGDRELVLRAARGEKDPELREAAIHLLGAMGATDRLHELYDEEVSVEVRAELLHALVMGGEFELVFKTARDEGSPELREEAIRALGMAPREQAAPWLLEMYAAEKDREVKGAIVEALMMQDQVKALVAIARKEQDRQLKRQVVEHLVMSGSPAARDYLLELLEER